LLHLRQSQHEVRKLIAGLTSLSAMNAWTVLFYGTSFVKEVQESQSEKHWPETCLSPKEILRHFSISM